LSDFNNAWHDLIVEIGKALGIYKFLDWLTDKLNK